MYIYIVIDDPPENFGEFEIIRTYKSRKDAKKFILNKKNHQKYACQYYTIIRRKLF